MHIAFGLAIVIVITIFVYVDAQKRGMNAFLWALGTLLFCIVFFPLYLILRKPVLLVLPPPGAPGASGPVGGARMCPACGRYYEGAAQFCPHCGARQV